MAVIERKRMDTSSVKAALQRVDRFAVGYHDPLSTRLQEAATATALVPELRSVSDLLQEAADVEGVDGDGPLPVNVERMKEIAEQIRPLLCILAGGGSDLIDAWQGLCESVDVEVRLPPERVQERRGKKTVLVDPPPDYSGLLDRLDPEAFGKFVALALGREEFFDEIRRAVEDSAGSEEPTE